MPKGRPFRVPRDQPGSLNPTSYGRKGRPVGSSLNTWAENMAGAGAGHPEVMVKITGGGRDADGAQAHFEYIARHGKLDIETDQGETLNGKEAGAALINSWGLNYGTLPDAPLARGRGVQPGERRPAKQAFNIVLSMPAGTPPQKVLEAVKKFAREEFALEHRYAMALHSNMKDAEGRIHGRSPHVHLVVKAEHEYGGPRLNPRKADLQRWREAFAQNLKDLGVAATATKQADRGLPKMQNKTAIYRAQQRPDHDSGKPKAPISLYTEAGDSTFMRKKLEGIKRELRARGTVEDREAYQSLLNVRARVNERYQEAINWLRTQGRLEEARRFELLHTHLPPVRTENQVIAEALRFQERLHKPDPSHDNRFR